MSDSFIKTPDDSGNPGKKIHVRSRVVGVDTVWEHVTQPTYADPILGLHFVHSGEMTVQSSAHGANAGFIYLINPIGSTVLLRLRKLRFVAVPKSTSTRSSSPEVRLEQFTFTGNAGATAIVSAIRKRTDATPIGKCYLASTGLTILADGVLRGYHVPLVPSGGGNVSLPNDATFEPNGDEGEFEMAAGEGLLVRQNSAGEGSDDRVVMIGMTWLEVAAP